MNKEELLVLIDWISENYTPDNGIGYWVPSHDNIADSITSEELLRLYREHTKYITPYKFPKQR